MKRRASRKTGRPPVCGRSSSARTISSSRAAALRYLRAAFNFGIPKWLKQNPIDQIEFTKIVNDGVEVIAPSFVEKLLFDALANDPGLVPWHVFTFFAGVRPEGEMSKLLWTDVHLDA